MPQIMQRVYIRYVFKSQNSKLKGEETWVYIEYSPYCGYSTEIAHIKGKTELP